MMKRLYTLLFATILMFTTTISEAQAPCALVGAVVTVPYSAPPIMMHAAVNGMSQYTFGWNDGTPVGSSSQKQFYSGWCVTITDLMTGCDTTICESCISTGGSGICPMIYAPVCGCDGTIYSNDCIAMQNGIFTFTSAIDSNGQLLPCTQPSTCEVEIDGDSIICTWGTPQVLTASPANGGSAPFTYLWSNGQSNLPILTIVNPGTYCVTQTDFNGCIDTACITVTTVQNIQIYSAPSPPIICLGDSIVLEIDTIGLSNIIWVPNTLFTPPVHRIVDFPIFTTTYVVEAVDSAGCDIRGEIEVILDSCITGIMHIMSNQVLIYPNPAKGNLTISMPKFEIFDLRIYDIIGRLVVSEDKISQSFIISVNTLSKGSYILHLSNAKAIITKKLMIE